MRQQGRDTRRRKGISVSLTPVKRQQSVPSSPLQSSQIQLHQSHVAFEEPQKVIGMRVPYRPVVKFEYSQVSKEHQMRESLALDQQLYLLRKEVENKKQIISDLRNQINQQQRQANPESIPVQKVHTRSFGVQNIEKSSSISTSPKKVQRQQTKKEDDKISQKESKNSNSEKENAAQWQRRKKQLKWAEDKMLQIIRVCDYGL